MYRERATYAREYLLHFYNSATGSDIALNFQHSMKYDVKISPPDEDVEPGNFFYALKQTENGDTSDFPSKQWVHVSLVHNPTTAMEGTVEIRWNGVVQPCSGDVLLQRQWRRRANVYATHRWLPQRRCR